MSYEVVQIASIGSQADAELARRYNVLSLLGRHLPPDLDKQASEASVLVTSVRRGLTQAMIQQLPALRAVCSWGVGHDTLDIGAARSAGVVVSSTPDVLDDCVADLAWALLLVVGRRVAAADRYVKDGHWREIGQFPETTRVSGKKLGVLGLGRIGQAVVERAAGFRMQVGYHNRREREGILARYFSDLVELADWADFLVVACPGTPDTHHLVNATVLNALGPSGILINVARGTVVDQTAMEASLANGSLGGAGLDVQELEPCSPEILRRMDQVVLTPHIGSCTRETRQDMGELVLTNVDAFLTKGKLSTPILV